MLQHREQPANDGGGHNPVADGERALQPNQRPIVGHRRK